MGFVGFWISGKMSGGLRACCLLCPLASNTPPTPNMELRNGPCNHHRTVEKGPCGFHLCSGFGIACKIRKVSPEPSILISKPQ